MTLTYSPTLSTWYNARNLERIEQVGEGAYSANDTQINSKQRPRIMVDMEKVLVIVLNKHQEQGIPMTKEITQKYAKRLHTQLTTIGLYNDTGERIYSTEQLDPPTVEFLVNAISPEENPLDVEDDADDPLEDPTGTVTRFM